MGEILLQDLIDKVRSELLSPNNALGYPLFFVEKVELEIQVAFHIEGGGTIKLSVLDWVGIEGGGKGTQERGHTIKITLSSILSHEEQVELVRQDAHLWDGVQRATQAALRKSAQKLAGQEEE